MLVLGLLAVGATIYVMSNPRCRNGCKAVMQHLLARELAAFF